MSCTLTLPVPPPVAVCIEPDWVIPQLHATTSMSPFVPFDHRFTFNFRPLELQKHINSHFFFLSFFTYGY